MMVEAAEEHKAKGVIITGSSSALGCLALKLFREKEFDNFQQ